MSSSADVHAANIDRFPINLSVLALSYRRRDPTSPRLAFLVSFNLWIREGEQAERGVRIRPRATMDSRIIVDIISRWDSRENDYQKT